MLSINKVSKNYGGLKVLIDVNTEIPEGKLFGLIGPNGAGKTTLFNIVTGVTSLSEGRITLGGKEISNLRPHQICRRGIARTFQNIRLIPDLTVMENVLLGQMAHNGLRLRSLLPHLDNRQERALRAEATDILDLLGLTDQADSLAGELPHGDQRHVEIARALATRPCLLLLDEPAAGMNEQESEELAKQIQRVHQELVRTILLIEHDMSLVMKVCERIAVLNLGYKIAEGTPEEIQQDPLVVEAYLGEAEE